MRSVAFILILLVALSGCSKTEPVENPFANGGDVNNPNDTANPYTIQGLHKYVFEPKCGNPACHDGSFEPDFRTVESSYNTLVYQPVIKNDPQNSYVYRVVPQDVGKSWLFERLTTGDPVLGRMPLYAPTLNNQEMQWVTGWITDGARDLNGNPASYPNTPPRFNYYYATDANNVRIDTSRVNGWSSPFKAPKASFNVIVSVQDDSTQVASLQLNQLKLSQDKDDFSNAITVQAVYILNHWVATIDGANITNNVQWFMRYYVEDGDNTGTTEYPSGHHAFWYKENASFIIQ